MSDFKANKI